MTLPITPTRASKVLSYAESSDGSEELEAREPASDSDEDMPLAKSKRKSLQKDSLSDEDAPSTQHPQDMDTDEDAPLAKSKPAAKRKSVIKKEKSPQKPKKLKTESAQSTPVKASPSQKGKKKAPVKSENGDEEGAANEEENYKWWLEENRDDTVKWSSLQHNGVLFPPEYVPHGVKMNYDGVPVTLKPEAEEVASFYAALIGTDWVENPIFRKNFFADFLEVLANDSSCPIKEFEKCDFTPITQYLEELKEKKKSMSKEEKLKIKEEKLKIEEQYGYAYLDGRKEKVGNFRIEPPGLFRGRGEHPKAGTLKKRVTPEQITLNIGSNDKIPDPPAGHTWGQIVHDNTVTWLAMWKENVNEAFKYVFLAANSSLKGQSDMKKFEKARELKNHINRVRQEYTEELRDKQMVIRQRATALHLIDRFALRAGNEKGDDEADTVGCCSLRFEHVTLEPPNRVIFDFLGKDSIRYYNEVEVDEQIFKNLKIFKREPKTEGDLLFDRLTTSLLNKYLSGFMPGLTAKVFRTFNASFTFQNELKKTPEDGTVAEKLLAYNRANRQVAILCNHQRAVAKGHGTQMSKLKDKVLALKYDLQKVKDQMLDVEPSLKKKRPELTEPESDLDDEFIERHEQALEEKEEKQAALKLAKENEKRRENGEPELKALPDEKRTKRGLPTDIDKLEKKYDQIVDRIKAMKMNLIDKDENKTTALGTSKINYIDPRISAAWCQKFDVPIEKIFPKTLREKFKWAMEMDKDWTF